MIDSIILGERLRQIRKQLRITQNQLAKDTDLTQSAISRLENGEEVYASVLLSVLHYYYGKVSLDNLFATEFSAEGERLRCDAYSIGLVLVLSVSMLLSLTPNSLAMYSSLLPISTNIRKNSRCVVSFSFRLTFFILFTVR